MLNMYRVVSLSLVMGLFFAAPLLCIHPVSFQIKKIQNSQSKEVNVVFKRTARYPRIKSRNPSTALARSIHRVEHQKLHREAVGSIGERDRSIQADYRKNWDAAEKHTGGGDVEAVSRTDL